MTLRSDRLKKLRVEHGFTQEDLAERAATNLRNIQRYEGGETEPSLDIASRIADALGTTTDYLAGRSDEAYPVTETNINAVEKLVITLLRRGQKLEAINVISNNASREASQ